MNYTDMTSNGTTDMDPRNSSPVLIKDLNEEEKPREKAGRLGLDSLTDVELLALLLGSGMSGKSVMKSPP